MTFTPDEEFGANLGFAKLLSSENIQQSFYGYLLVSFLENGGLSERDYCSVLSKQKAGQKSQS